MKKVILLTGISLVLLPAFQANAQTGQDLSVGSILFPSVVQAAANTPLKVNVTNTGTQNVTSVTLSYSVDGGTAVSQVFDGLNIAPQSSATLSFNAPVLNPGKGSHNLTVNIPQASGTQKTQGFSVASQSVDRAGLIEEFTSSTCPPCAGFNNFFDPLVLTNNGNVPSANFNVIKYQMNWPNPGNDVSYNGHGSMRRSYYGVSGIPDHFTNGAAGGGGNQAEIDACKANPTNMTITGSYIIKGDSVVVTAIVTPHFTITNGNYRVHMAAVEKHYTNNGATTSQKEYYHVMRQMFPNASGNVVTSWTDSVSKTFTYTAKYNVGSVAQGNFNFWGTPFNSNLIIFVQDNNNKEVLQSKAVPAQWPQSVREISGLSNVVLYPNPTNDAAQIMMNLTESVSLKVLVTDALGRTVYQVAEQQYSAGTRQIALPTSGFASGLYNVSILSDKGAVTRRLSVVK